MCLWKLQVLVDVMFWSSWRFGDLNVNLLHGYDFELI